MKKYRKQSIRRSQQRAKQVKLKLLYANVRGINGKLVSLKGILETTQPHIVGLKETHKNVDSNLNINGYIWIGRERKQKQGGGIGLLIRKEMKNHISIHKIGEEDSEILWIQYRQKNIKDLYIGIYYGKQESRTPKEDNEKEMSSLETDILQIKEEDGEIILMGDFNIKIVQGSSRDSMLLNKVVEDCNLVVLNKTDKCQGTWTRVNTKNEKEKSVIDYIITTNEMYDNVKDMIIDEEGCYKEE